MDATETLAGVQLYYKRPTGFQWWWLIWIGAALCVFACGTAVGVVSSVAGGGGGWLGIGGLLAPPPFGGAERVSILMVGADNSRGEGLADSIIYIMVTPGTGEVAAVSIPRDSRVEIPGHGTTRINASHSYGGIELTQQTVANLLQLPVDYYIEVDVPGLVKLVDSVGGIDIDVEKRMHYTDRSQKLYIDLQPGPQHLNGTQAMGFVRFRHDAVGDLGRMERQRTFMRAVLKKLFSPQSVMELPNILDTFLKTVHTNLTATDVFALKRIVEANGPEAIRTATLPAAPVRVHGADMLDLDPQGVKEVVDRVLLHQGMTVIVLNGTGSSGLASRVGEQLAAKGCEIVSTGNAEQPAKTTLIIDHRSSARRAEQIAAWIGRGVLSVDPDAESPADVTIIVGSDMLSDTPTGSL